MSYIGKTPTVGNFIKLDDISTSSTNSYTLQHNSVNFSPESANHMLVSLNGVIQAPTSGYSIESDSTIVFSSAPEAPDKIFASFIGEVAASFDIADNTVDEFTANGSTTTFTLSKTVSSSNDLLVTLDGVTQYPNTQSATRAYSVIENVLTFTPAPAAGVVIQARHIGFGGASSSAVTGFYGRTGNVSLKNTDNVDVNNLTAAGTVTVTGDLNVSGDLTYDETVSRNLNVTGVATVASGIVSTGDFKIGTATTLSQDNIFTTGIITASGGVDAIGIMSAGISQATGIITALNFIGTGNTVLYNQATSTVDISIAGGGGGAVGAGTDKVFYENDQTVTQSYSISAGKNAMVAGPIAIASGETVTVPSGSELTIV